MMEEMLQQSGEAPSQGLLCGSVPSLYDRYVEAAQATGLSPLSIEVFWNVLRIRFPGSDWTYANYGTPDEDCVGRAVVVVPRSEDEVLASLIDEGGWFKAEGYDVILAAVLDAQISKPAESGGLTGNAQRLTDNEIAGVHGVAGMAFLRRKQPAYLALAAALGDYMEGFDEPEAKSEALRQFEDAVAHLRAIYREAGLEWGGWARNPPVIIG